MRMEFKKLGKFTNHSFINGPSKYKKMMIRIKTKKIIPKKLKKMLQKSPKKIIKRFGI
jgi:hypothetical protein